jgi:sugar lactone lactonase YvrE
VRGLSSIEGVIGSSGATLYLATTDRIVQYDPKTQTVAAYASIPDVLPCFPGVPPPAPCDASVGDSPPHLKAAVVDGAGALYVVDGGQAAVWRVAPGGKEVRQLVVDRTWTSPLRPSGPSALAFLPDGSLAIAVESSLASDGGAVYRLALSDDGTPGAVSTLAQTPSGSRPVGLVAGASGKLYVVLAGIGRVSVIGADGREVASTPASDAAALKSPRGVAFRERSLMVTVASGPDGGDVMRLPVDDTAPAPR